MPTSSCTVVLPGLKIESTSHMLEENPEQNGRMILGYLHSYEQPGDGHSLAVVKNEVIGKSRYPWKSKQIVRWLGDSLR